MAAKNLCKERQETVVGKSLLMRGLELRVQRDATDANLFHVYNVDKKTDTCTDMIVLDAKQLLAIIEWVATK